MIEAIKTKPELLSAFDTSCIDNGIGAYIDSGIQCDQYIIINVDKYYDNLHLANKPPTADKLALVECLNKNDGHSIFIIENKNIKNLSKLYTIDGVKTYKKFETVISDLFKTKYPEIFLNVTYSVKNLHMYLISDPFQICSSQCIVDLPKVLKGTFIEYLLLCRPLEFRGKYYMIEYKIPFPILKKE